MFAGGWKVPKKGTILIRENGQPIQTMESQEQKDEVTTGREEQAASFDDSKPPSHFDRIQVNHQKKTKIRSIYQFLKPFVVTIVTAIIVGSVLGFLMLRMFGGVGADTEDEQGTPVSSFQNTNESEDETQKITLDSIDTFIMQGGVFTEEDNALEWKSKFEDSGLPTMLWEREDQLFLFVGLATTKEAGVNAAEEYADLDIYVKEWSVPSGELEGSAEEEEWLETFLKQWQISMEELESTDSFQLEEWEQLVEKVPSQSEKLASLATEIESIENHKNLEGRVQLLQLLYEYEQVIE